MSTTNRESAKESTKDNLAKSSNDQAVLIRDESTQILMIVGLEKVSTGQKKRQIVPGTVVSWQNSPRERWRGAVLFVGQSVFLA